MLIDNRLIIKELNPSLYSALSKMEQQSLNILVEPSRQGEATLAILRDGKPHYLYSKYNPLKEVQSFLEKAEDLTEIKHIFLIGIGLGYHLNSIIETYPNLKVTLYEPNIEILSYYLSKYKLTSNIVSIFTNLDEINDTSKLQKYFSETTATIIWPSYLRLFEDEITTTKNKLVEILKSTKRSLATNTVFQTRWIANSLLNYPHVLNTSNIITEKYEQLFNDKPIIIAAAGPSLKGDIEIIRKIKEEKSAYIFAVGSGVNVLLHHDILPDAVFSYDPGEANQRVLQKVKEKNIKNLPIVFGSSVGYETLINYPSKKVHMITSVDKLATNLLDIKQSQVILDSPSIAVMTLQVCKKLKMNPIILAGQNLAYLNDKMYSDGGELARGTNTLSESEIADRIVTTDVEGNEIFTNEGFIDMKVGLEAVIANYNYGKVINTTKHGAHIEGTEFMSLDVVKETLLVNKNIVQEDWVIDELEYNDGVTEFRALYEDYTRMMKNIDKATKIANEIKQAYDAKIYAKINELVDVYTTVFKKIFDSVSFQSIIKPAIQVQSEKFGANYKAVMEEKHPRKKAQKFIDVFYSYLGSVYETTEGFYPIIRKVEYDLKDMSILKS